LSWPALAPVARFANGLPAAWSPAGLLVAELLPEDGLAFPDLIPSLPPGISTLQPAALPRGFDRAAEGGPEPLFAKEGRRLPSPVVPV